MPRGAWIGAIALAMAWGGDASAHAFLTKASPRVGSRIAASPREVRLWFSEGLEALFSSIAIDGPAGAPVAEGPVRVEGADRRQMVAALPRPLAPGRYRVRWKAVAVDSHKTQGDFVFLVGP